MNKIKAIPEKNVLLGVPLDNVDLDDTLQRIHSYIEDFAEDGIPRYVTTPNVDFLVNILRLGSFREKHPELAAVYRDSEMAITDGMAVVAATKLLGARVKGRVAGSDLVPTLIRTSRNLKIYMLGGDEETLKKTEKVIHEMNPTIDVVGMLSPFIHVKGDKLVDFPEEDLSITSHINACKPDILLIGLGNPKQELWFRRNRHRLAVPVSLGIGGTFNFMIGRVNRAPRFMQVTGLEWLYRVYVEPRRLWRRYSKGIVLFGQAMAISFLADRFVRLARFFVRPNSGPALPRKEIRKEACVINVAAALTHETVPFHRDLILEESTCCERTVLDFSGTNYIDSAGLGFVFSLRKVLADAGGRLRLCGVSRLLKLQMFAQRCLAPLGAQMSQNVETALFSMQNEEGAGSVTCRASEEKGTLRVDLSGELTVETAAVLDEKEMLPAGYAGDLLVDMEGLDFIDTTGIGKVLKLKERLASPSKHLIRVRKGKVRDMFAESDLDDSLNIHAR
jgi:N-acetylglucosaminyldiphosphoundecaprenol N-acetyl-beta-D-mannosaminyltransferase